jgi:hypothetical protein
MSNWKFPTWDAETGKFLLHGKPLEDFKVKLGPVGKKLQFDYNKGPMPWPKPSVGVIDSETKAGITISVDAPYIQKLEEGVQSKHNPSFVAQAMKSTEALESFKEAWAEWMTEHTVTQLDKEILADAGLKYANPVPKPKHRKYYVKVPLAASAPPIESSYLPTDVMDTYTLNSEFMKMSAHFKNATIENMYDVTTHREVVVMRIPVEKLEEAEAEDFMVDVSQIFANATSASDLFLALSMAWRKVEDEDEHEA